VAMQNHLNVIYREEEREMLPLCIDLGVGVIPWSPLARGFLAGNRNRDKEGPTTRAKTDTLAQEYYYNPEDFDVLDRVIKLAEDHEVAPAQIALAWLLNKPGITAPVVGASKMAHLEQAVAAVEIDLSDEEMAFLEEPYQPHAILGHE
jgi:aryl-alcohol dehydrogenase-like predicted oxidoreductase